MLTPLPVVLSPTTLPPQVLHRYAHDPALSRKHAAAHAALATLTVHAAVRRAKKAEAAPIWPRHIYPGGMLLYSSTPRSIVIVMEYNCDCRWGTGSLAEAMHGPQHVLRRCAAEGREEGEESGRRLGKARTVNVCGLGAGGGYHSWYR